MKRGANHHMNNNDIKKWLCKATKYLVGYRITGWNRVRTELLAWHKVLAQMPLNHPANSY
jgi:hypothetical protein